MLRSSSRGWAKTRLLEHVDVVEAIVSESEAHDMTVIGTTREGILQQILFGTIPEAVGVRPMARSSW